MSIFPSLKTFHFLTPQRYPQRYLCVKVELKPLSCCVTLWKPAKRVLKTLGQKQCLVLEKGAIFWVNPVLDHWSWSGSFQKNIASFYQMTWPPFLFVVLQKATIWRGSFIVILDCFNIRLSLAKCWNSKILPKIRSRLRNLPTSWWRGVDVICSALMSRIERKYCLISTSYLAGLCDIFILLHISQNCVCFGDFLPMRTLCDAYHKEFESH